MKGNTLNQHHYTLLKQTSKAQATAYTYMVCISYIPFYSYLVYAYLIVNVQLCDGIEILFHLYIPIPWLGRSPLLPGVYLRCRAVLVHPDHVTRPGDGVWWGLLYCRAFSTLRFSPELIPQHVSSRLLFKFSCYISCEKDLENFQMCLSQHFYSVLSL